jgi:hypothetical protein
LVCDGIGFFLGAMEFLGDVCLFLLVFMLLSSMHTIGGCEVVCIVAHLP